MRKYIKKGFSITELLVAMMVFTVGILSIVNIFPIYKRLSRISEKSTVAVFLAQEKIEELVSKPYSEIEVGTVEAKGAIEAEGEFSVYQRQTVVSYIDGDYQVSGEDLGLKKATSTVYWYEGDMESSESLVTVLSER